MYEILEPVLRIRARLARIRFRPVSIDSDPESDPTYIKYTTNFVEPLSVNTRNKLILTKTKLYFI
jgi:hypothetical protein